MDSLVLVARDDLLDELSLRFSKSLFYACAASRGHLHLLKWAHEQGYPWDQLTCAQTARVGHLEMLKWLKEQACPWNEWTCHRAAEGGHLEVLQWLKEQGCPWDVYSKKWPLGSVTMGTFTRLPMEFKHMRICSTCFNIDCYCRWPLLIQAGVCLDTGHFDRKLTAAFRTLAPS